MFLIHKKNNTNNKNNYNYSQFINILRITVDFIFKFKNTELLNKRFKIFCISYRKHNEKKVINL